MIGCLQSFMVTRSCQFGDCFYWKLLPEYTTCLGWMAAVVLPTGPRENRIQPSLKPNEEVGMWDYLCLLLNLSRHSSSLNNSLASGPHHGIGGHLPSVPKTKAVPEWLRRNGSNLQRHIISFLASKSASHWSSIFDIFLCTTLKQILSTLLCSLYTNDVFMLVVHLSASQTQNGLFIHLAMAKRNLYRLDER